MTLEQVLQAMDVVLADKRTADALWEKAKLEVKPVKPVKPVKADDEKTPALSGYFWGLVAAKAVKNIKIVEAAIKAASDVDLDV